MRTVAVCVIATALTGLAVARGIERFQFRVDTKSGAVHQIWTAAGGAANTTRPAPPARLGSAQRGRPVTVASLPQGGSAVVEGGAVVVRDPTGAVLARIPRRAYEFVPWMVVLRNVAVFALREPSGRPAPNDYRDVWTAIDRQTARTLWRRESAWHDPPGAVALNDDTLLIDDWQKVELVDGRTGTTLRVLPKTNPCASFSAVLLADGLLVEAGDDLHLLDRHAGATRWRLTKHGKLVSWLPIGPRRLLLQTTERDYLVGAAHGRIIWQAAASSRSPLWLFDDLLFEASLERQSTDEAAVGLTVRRLADGGVVGTHAVQRHRGFFDVGEAEILDVADGHVRLETTWIILD
jgi:hypothetical protein